MVIKFIKDETKAVFADSGYMSQERKRTLRSKGIFNGITERRVRGQSKLRTLVELPFPFIKKLMKYTEIKYLGLHKNSRHVFLIVAAYNLRQMLKLVQRYE